MHRPLSKSPSTPPTALTRIKAPSTLNQAAVQQLREAIVKGELKPGTVLKDAEVARQLGLSATPVREALLQLSAEGLVEIEPNRQKRVTPINHQAMFELCQVQNELWMLGYAWGAKNIGEDELARLATAKDLQREFILKGDIFEAVTAAHAFYEVLFEASHNRELERIAKDRIPLMVRYIVLCAPEIINSDMIDHLETLYQALKVGNIKVAKPILKRLSDIVLNAIKALCDAEKNNT